MDRRWLGVAALAAACGGEPALGGSSASADDTAAEQDASGDDWGDIGGEGDGDGDGDGDEGGDGGTLPPCEDCEAIGFRDVAAGAGLVHPTSEPFRTPPDCLVDTIDPPFEGHFCAIDWSTGGAAVADFDGDDWPDIFLPTLYGPDRLYRNLGNDEFEDVAADVGIVGDTNSAGAAFFDADNDGDLDLYVLSVGEYRHRFYINEGGTFTNEAKVRGAAVEDGYPHTGTSVAVGDYDRDGYLDVFTGDWHTHAIGTQPSHNRLLHNRGDEAPGFFEDVTEIAGVDVIETVYQTADITLEGTFVLSATWADMDGDGWQDLLLPSDFSCTRLLWNQGDGTFLDTTEASGVGTDENGMGATVADIDNDGDLDWMVTSISNGNKTGNRLYRYEGDRLFSDATTEYGVREGFWGWGVEFFDFENDGDLDGVMTNGWRATENFEDPMLAWVNDGSGGAWIEGAQELGFTDVYQGRGLYTIDFDRDGDLDVLVARHGQEPLLYRNNVVTTDHWTRIKVVGTTSNVDAIGARVTVTTEEFSRLYEVGASAHYSGHGERDVFVGLGDAEVFDVTVTFPVSGETIELEAQSADQLIVVEEP